MAHLFTFGDSWTYGHGLNDCVERIEQYYAPGLNPSQYAWPKILKDMLGCKSYTNAGIPGNTNHNIWYQAHNLSVHMKPEDYVVCLWSYPNRYSYIDESRLPVILATDGLQKNYHARFMNDLTFIRRPDVQNPKLYKFYHGYLTNRSNDTMNTMLRVDQLSMFLKDKVKKHINASIEPIESTQTRKYFKNKMTLVWQTDVTHKGKCIDNNHPDEEAHYEFASLLYNKITEANK